MLEVGRVDSSVVQEIMNDVFQGMLQENVTPRVSARVPAEHMPVMGLISLVGPKRYALVVCMSEKLALSLAEILLQTSLPAWNHDVEDAVGELVNVIAGNVKPHVAPGMSLSLPSVIHGRHFSMELPRMSTVQCEEFSCKGEPLSVTLACEA